MSLRRSVLRSVFVALASWPAFLSAQVPAGPEFRVNTFTTGTQTYSAVAADPAGNFVVVWDAASQDGSGRGIFGQRFDSAGVPRGAEFRVNSYTSGLQYLPSVAVDAAGNFVVAWMSYTQDGDGWAVVAQRFAASGEPRGTEFVVNSYTTGLQYYPSVAADAAGRFVVAWRSRGQDGSNSAGIFAQRYDGSGTPLGTELRVNTYTAGNARFPAVAADAGGNLVVAWESYLLDGSGSGIFARRFDASGLPAGGEFRVNTYTTLQQRHAAVAADAAGNFVVAWQSNQDGSGYGVFAQRYDAAGVPRGPEFRVNTETTGQQVFASAGFDEAGNFVLAWRSGGIFVGQRYDAAGNPRGGEFTVSSGAINYFAPTGLASDAAGNFVVTWASNAIDGDGVGVAARRFGGLQPAVLSVDPAPSSGSDGNGVFEPGEQVFVSPAWHNVADDARTFQGSGLRFSGPVGPGGPFYGLIDSHADYGTVPGGSNSSCGDVGDCYVLSISVPATRPAQHWDARFDEGVLPDALGQRKRWPVHVGGSFTDVPRSNPFYRFVETLLHKGITGGCGAGTYCPGSVTTRDQMSVFVLLAKEGAGYAPPACGTPVFNDVPASNPFCRFIEELSRRGVVSGCGGGNYCPGNPVTREQMAVFVLRTLDPALNPPACVAGSELFADVPASSGFCKWIEELARRGVVTGCGGGNYCPTASVTREQMGVFISGTFGLTLYGV